MNRPRFIRDMIALIMLLAILYIGVNVVFAAADPAAWSLAVTS